MVYWDIRETEPVHSLDAAAEQKIVALEPTGVLFATAGDDNVVRLWRFKDASLVETGVGHSTTVRSLTFSPDGKQLVSGGDDGSVLVWNIFIDEANPGMAPATDRQ